MDRVSDIFFQYNPWWEDEMPFDGIIDRPEIISKIQQQLKNKNIIILTGLRRIGKTTLMKLMIKKLLESGVKPERILYISCDDYLLQAKSIIEIIQDFRTVQRLPLKTKVYLFLDEITSKPDFQKQLKNIYDSHSAKIVATSSSASILRDKKAYLTGREIVIEIPPLNFTEYLTFRDIKVKARDRHLLKRHFEDFMICGGIPEFVLYQDRAYLQNLVDDIIYKDIIALNNIKHHSVIKDFFLLLMERSGKQFSINKIANILNITPDTAKRYLNFFCETYLISLVPRFGKTNETLLSPKKIYCCDIGIRSHYTGFRDLGSLFENYVYLQIKNHNVKYIYKNQTELDFIVDKKVLIEVKYGRVLNKKQMELFNTFKAKQKYMIQSFDEIRKVVETLLYT